MVVTPNFIVAYIFVKMCSNGGEIIVCEDSIVIRYFELFIAIAIFIASLGLFIKKTAAEVSNVAYTKHQRAALKKFLSRFDEFSCPDNYHEAYQILFFGKHYGKNDNKIIELAIEDMEESDRTKLIKNFDENRADIEGLSKRKYNWF
jgi:hypothetical protein